MQTATLKQVKDELSFKSAEELMAICLELSKFKKENKEFLSYILFESENEEQFVRNTKDYLTLLFSEINTNSHFYIRKSVRKILTLTKKYIRFSKNKESEIELLLHFCQKLKDIKPAITNSTRLQNTLNTQLRLIKKSLEKLHEDLQHDYLLELNKLLDE